MEKRGGEGCMGGNRGWRKGEGRAVWEGTGG